MGTGHASPAENPPLVFFLLLILVGLRYLWHGLHRDSRLNEQRRPYWRFNLFEFSTEERNEYLAAGSILGGGIATITGAIGVGWYLWNWL